MSSAITDASPMNCLNTTLDFVNITKVMQSLHYLMRKDHLQTD